jgi:hypothetical protein
MKNKKFSLMHLISLFLIFSIGLVNAAQTTNTEIGPITLFFIGLMVIFVILIIIIIIYLAKAKKIRDREEFFHRLNSFSRKPKKDFVAEVKQAVKSK